MTRSARRSVALRTFEDMAEELNRIGAAHASDALGTVGRWTPGENLEHCVQLMEYSLDGFPEGAWETVPRGVRLVAKNLVKPLMIAGLKPGRAAPAGTRLPKWAAFMQPRAGAEVGQAIGRTRAVVTRLRAGERFERESPLFGRLSHESWSRVHLSHCSLHWSFLTLGGAADEAGTGGDE